MSRFDIKSKTFFQIPPSTKKPFWDDYYNGTPIVFMDLGFKLDKIIMITEPAMERDLHYTFTATLSHKEEEKLTFEFKRKHDCIMAQRELTRAWTRTGEFAYDEDVPSGEGTDTE